MAERFDWKTVADRRDVVHRTVETLTAGGVALFPTDTVYHLVASATSPAGLERISAAAKKSEHRPVLSLVRPTDLFRFAPSMPKAGRRLVDRCLPGPLVLVTAVEAMDGELSDFPTPAQNLVSRPEGLSMQVADHPSLLQTLRLLGTPVIALSIVDGVDADKALAKLDVDVDAIIDDGPTRYLRPPTVVQVIGTQISVLSEGILTANRVGRLAGEIVTFVCTGNTCRSPMAEGIFKRIVADSLGCEPNELSDRGYTILSAGVAATVGGPPADEAVRIAHEYNIGIEDHATAPLNSDLVRLSDRIVTMTRDHQRIVNNFWPDAAEKTTTLGGAKDIADPVGHPIERYRQCAAEMAEHLQQLWKQMQSTA